MRKVKINGKRIGLKKVFEVPISFGLVDELSKWQIRLREDDIKRLEQQIEYQNQSKKSRDKNLEDTSDESLTLEQQIKGLKQEINDARNETQPVNDLIKFFQDTLHLSPKDVKTVKYGCDEEDLGEFMVYLNLMVNGLTTEEEFDKAMKFSEDKTKEEPIDPKKEKAN